MSKAIANATEKFIHVPKTEDFNRGGFATFYNIVKPVRDKQIDDRIKTYLESRTSSDMFSIGLALGVDEDEQRESKRLVNNGVLNSWYFIRNDIYGSKNPNFIQDDETRPLELIRNYIEHRSIILNDDGGIKGTDYVLYISRANFEICAMALIRRVRSAIIYLCNMVANESYDREQEIKSKGMMYGESYIGCIPDEDKV